MVGDRYRRLEDLYRVGEVVEFNDDDNTVMWVQVMNPLEADNAREESRTARSRIILALKEVGSNDQTQALAQFRMLPKATAVDEIVASQQPKWLSQADEKMRDDPDWKERLEILDRQAAIMANPAEDSERELLRVIVEDYMAEIYRRIGEDADYERDRLMEEDETVVEERWLELYQQRRGDKAAFDEHQATAGWYAARDCVASRVSESDKWDHSQCSHSLVYPDKAAFRSSPPEIQTRVFEALSRLTMSQRDSKNSHSAENSSDSSALPAKPEESMPSTPTETPSSVPGTSTQPSVTP